LLAFCCLDGFIVPRLANDGPVLNLGAPASPLASRKHRAFAGVDAGAPREKRHSLAAEFFSTLGSFFQKPGILMALAFILLYRFDEAQLSKVISPFLLDNHEKGGLGLTTSQVGLAYGTFGIL